MKTTIDISDALLGRARRHARRMGVPLRAVVEEGLRRVIETEPVRAKFRLADRSVGDESAPNPLESFSWQDLRDEIYGGR
jgi:hypothetical protein